jgi:hypothetical protein
MGLFDSIRCEYPLRDPAHQDLECLMDHDTNGSVPCLADPPAGLQQFA